jgi:hypothetical protein
MQRPAPLKWGRAAVKDHPLADRLGLVLARQVVVERADVLVAVHRAGDLGERVRQRDERPPGRAGARGHIVGVQVGRIDLLVITPVADHAHSWTFRTSLRASVAASESDAVLHSSVHNRLCSGTGAGQTI